MDVIEFFIYVIFFVILFIVFKNEFMNLCEEFTSHFLNNINNTNTTCDTCKQCLWYLFNPKEYLGNWGFKAYKRLRVI